MKNILLKDFYVNIKSVNHESSSMTLVKAKNEYSAAVDYLTSGSAKICFNIQVDINDIPLTLEELIIKMKQDYNVVFFVESLQVYNAKLQQYEINTLSTQIKLFEHYILKGDHLKPVKLTSIFLDYFGDVEMEIFKIKVKEFESFRIFDLKLFNNKYKKVTLSIDQLNDMKLELENHLNHLKSELHLI